MTIPDMMAWRPSTETQIRKALASKPSASDIARHKVKVKALADKYPDIWAEAQNRA